MSPAIAWGFIFTLWAVGISGSGGRDLNLWLCIAGNIQKLILPSGKTNSLLWKDPPFLMGKSTINHHAINSYVTNYQRVMLG